MKEINKEEKLHRNCDPHDADHCDINDHSKLEPVVDDCGHYVKSGPGYQQDIDSQYGPEVGLPAPGNPGGPKHDDDQNPEHGPGVPE